MLGIFHDESDKQKLLQEGRFEELGKLLDEEYEEAIRKAAELSYLKGLVHGLKLDIYDQLQAFKGAVELDPENKEYRQTLEKAQVYWDSLKPVSKK